MYMHSSHHRKPIKKPVSLRIDADLVAMLRQQGRGWQTHLNNRLRQNAKTVAATAPVKAQIDELYRPIKVPVSIRLDADLLQALRASGRGWQSRINTWLRDTLRG